MASCRDGEEVVQAVRRNRPDVLVLDMRMPRTDGLTVLREMRREHLDTRVVLLTAALDGDEMLEALLAADLQRESRAEAVRGWRRGPGAEDEELGHGSPPGRWRRTLLAGPAFLDNSRGLPGMKDP